jgi:hypothetical protein
MMLCVVFSDDLMFSQMVANALPDNCSIRPASNQATAEKALDASVSVLIVDLSLRFDNNQLVKSAHAADVRIVGIASHVHVSKIESAHEAGFDVVLTRGQIADKLGSVVSPNGC